MRRWLEKTSRLFILALPGVVLLSAFLSGSLLLYRLAYFLVFLWGCAYLWAFLNSRGMSGSVVRPVLRTEAGRWVEEKSTVRNQGRWPKVLLEVRLEGELPGEETGRLLTLRPGASASWTRRTYCQRRGLYRTGPLLAVAADPLGLFSRPQILQGIDTLLVYPQSVELREFRLPTSPAWGKGRHELRSFPVTTIASGVREHTPGDSLSRIHWPTTARTGQLMIKNLEADRPRDEDPASPNEVWVVLDLSRSAQAGDGPENTEEYGVTLAASLVKKFIKANFPTGLVAGGQKLVYLPPARGQGHLERMLEALAVAGAGEQGSQGELLSMGEGRWGPNTAALVITPSGRHELALPVEALLRTGARLAVVLLDKGSFGGEGGQEPTRFWLTSLGVESYLVRRGDSIAQALSYRR